MTYVFKCKDIGMKDTFEVQADTKEELLPVIQAHAKASHGINEVTPDLLQKINAAIKKKGMF